MTDDFAALDAWLGRALQALEPAARARLTRRAAKLVADRTRADMTAQRGPDGTAWEPRRRKKAAKTDGKPAVVGTRAHILYVNASGEASSRMINIRQVLGSGPTAKVVAFDERDRKLKTFKLDRVKAGLALDDLKAGPIRKTVKMMMGLRQARRLGVRATAEGAEVGWRGNDARIASVHQTGGVDHVDAELTAAYPARPLLGFAPGDLPAVRALLVAALTGD